MKKRWSLAIIVPALLLLPLNLLQAAPGDFCNLPEGIYGDGNAGAEYTKQQVDDVLNFVNSVSQAILDTCTGISSSEAVNLFNGKPYNGIGTLGADETAGEVPGHIDSVSYISETSSDNDLVRLRVCAPVTTSCSTAAGKEIFSYTIKFANNQQGQPSSQCTAPMCTYLKSLIEAATTSIDFAIYGLRGAPEIISALQDAVSRGVAVRGIVDTETGSCDPDPANFLYSNTHDLITALGTDKVKCDATSFSYIMHNKFFVFDRAKTLMGTANVSDSGIVGEYNANTFVVFESTRLAQIYTDEFNEMFVDGKFHRGKTDNTTHVLDSWYDDTTVVKSYFSPTDTAKAKAVFDLVDNSVKTLDIQMFFFTDQEVADKIIAAHNRGVAVRMIIDAGGGSNAYSKTGLLCNAGIPVKTENWGSKQHNKWGVADSNVPGKGTVVVGSMNWTLAGDEKNDENTIYVRNDSFAGEFQADFDAKWASLSTVAPCTWIAAEGNSSSVCTNDNCETQCVSGSCCDSSDNDYDGQADSLDNGCYDANRAGPANFCESGPGNPGAGNYGKGGKSPFTNQQIHDTLIFVNGATQTELDACTGISLSKARDLFKGKQSKPYNGIGTIGADERKGEIPGHIDSVNRISAKGNDLVDLRDCAPTTNTCAIIESTMASCSDGQDNDGDGYIDAADFNCWAVLGLASEDNLEKCSDSKDNDGDGFIDAADFDCRTVLGL